MTYFDCFMVGSWMLVIGWFLGAIYVQNHSETAESSRVSKTLTRVTEKPEPCPECQGWRLPVVTSASAD
jgi:hypothetical protein